MTNVKQSESTQHDTVVVSLRISPVLLKRIEELAERDQRSRNNMMSILLERSLAVAK
jgi:hypothetical protein